MEETKTTLEVYQKFQKAGLDISCNECMETLEGEEKEE